MSDNYADIAFRKEVRDVFKRMPVMRTEQFIRMMSKFTGLAENDDALNYVIRPFLTNGYILLSDNGYATTKENYEIVAKDYASASKEGEIRIKGLVPFEEFNRYMDCFNIILEFYPKSSDFVLTRNLFQATFVDMEKNLIYEIIRIPNNMEDLYRKLILKESMQYSYGCGKLIYDRIRRIAIVEDAACAEEVPYCGFTRICVLDTTVSRRFSIVEKRKDDIWKDMVIYQGLMEK